MAHDFVVSPQGSAVCEPTDRTALDVFRVVRSPPHLHSIRLNMPHLTQILYFRYSPLSGAQLKLIDDTLYSRDTEKFHAFLKFFLAPDVEFEG